MEIKGDLLVKKFLAGLIHSCIDGRGDMLNAHKSLLFSSDSKNTLVNDALVLDGHPFGCYQMVKEDPKIESAQNVVSLLVCISYI